MSATMKHRIEFAQRLALYAPQVSAYELAEATRALLRMGATYGRIAENDCNGYADWQGNWDQRAADRAEAQSKRIEERLTKVATALGATADFQGDPRGYTVRLVWPPQAEYLAPCELGIPTS